jgi:HD-GYP domain-containing protein (c-di-GMP phosphodiesterase class II)
VQGSAVQQWNADGLLEATVEALSSALGLRDGCTAAHSSRVVTLSCLVGRQLGLRPASFRDLQYAAALHDIGKVGVPDAVLLKSGPLAATEWTVIRSHSGWGADVIAKVPGLERVATIVRHHHERYDGTGYPDGLAGEDIPIESRALAVADAYVAMTEDRPYRPALSSENAAGELSRQRATQFDPRAVDALAAELERSELLRAAS